MTLEQLVPSLDLCQQLKAAGFPQDTALRWSMQHEPHIPDVEPTWMSTAFNEPILCAAPTAEEILKELPWSIQPWLPNITSLFLHAVREPAGFRVVWRTWDNKQEEPCDDDERHSEKESEAAALAYLWWKKEVAG